jgi:hypothetical protein
LVSELGRDRRRKLTSTGELCNCRALPPRVFERNLPHSKPEAPPVFFAEANLLANHSLTSHASENKAWSSLACEFAIGLTPVKEQNLLRRGKIVGFVLGKIFFESWQEPFHAIAFSCEASLQESQQSCDFIVDF